MTQRSVAGRAFALIALALTATTAGAEAARVIVARVEIRSEPQAAATVLGGAERGEFLEVVEEAGNGWLVVRLPGSAKLGFVDSRSVERISAPPASAAEPGPPAAPALPQGQPAQGPRREWERVSVALSGALSPQGVELAESTTFSKYLEDTGRLDTSYGFARARGVDLALRVHATAWLGLELAVETGSRQGDAHADAEVPHPLLFERNRTLRHDVDDLAVSERAIHASLVLAHRRGRLHGSLFGGVSFYSIKADLLQRLEFEQQYPFEDADVTITAAPLQRLSDTPVGGSVGASADFKLHRNAGLGVVLRYRFATARLSRPPGEIDDSDVTGTQILWPATAPVELEISGVRIGAGVRFYF